MKDLPTTPVDGLVVVAIPNLRPRDDIVILKEKHKLAGLTDLSQLEKGSRVGMFIWLHFIIYLSTRDI